MKRLMSNGRPVFPIGKAISCRTWLDDDKTHVWVGHSCENGRTITMLPWPTWHARGKKVEPSISCTCGLHAFMTIGSRPVPGDDDYKLWRVDATQGGE